MAGQGRSVLDPGAPDMALHRWQVEQHREASGALDQRADSRAVQTYDHVTFPVTGNGPIRGLGGTLADHYLWSDERLPTLLRSGARHTQ